jgi:hypothetical protein
MVELFIEFEGSTKHESAHIHQIKARDVKQQMSTPHLNNRPKSQKKSLESITHLNDVPPTQGHSPPPRLSQTRTLFSAEEPPPNRADDTAADAFADVTYQVYLLHSSILGGFVAANISTLV